ncbi:MAG: hypothetical protein H7333_10695 [Bdellovibrionales bacterium]|nr:hypothetical protein [Oligoflexia bacterium]
MRIINAFNLGVIVAAAFFTWTAVAEPMKVHVLENLSIQESKEMKTALTELGYQPSSKTLFTESHDAIIVTKALKTERDPASISIELVHQDKASDLPRTVFQRRVEGNDLRAMIKALPAPGAFKGDSTTPMAFQKSE